MVDDERHRALRPAAEKPDAYLRVAVYGNALFGKPHYGTFEVVRVGGGEHVVNLIRLHDPVRLDEIVVVARMQHGRRIHLKRQRAFEFLLVDVPVVIEHAVHHSVVIVAEKILHLVPHFRSQNPLHPDLSR